MTFADIYAGVRDQGGFDTSATGSSLTLVKSWVNEAYRRLVIRSKWRKAQVQIAVTVANQAEYALPSTVEDIVEGVLVDTEPYTRIGQETLWRLKNGDATADGGVWAEDYSAAGAAQIELYPAPVTAGLAISALAVLAPVDLSGDGDVPGIPADFHPALIDGGIAIGLKRLELRLDEAAALEAGFVGEIETLRRRSNARLSTGPVQIQVGGYHF